MNHNYRVVLAEEFLRLLNGKWRFVDYSVRYNRTEGIWVVCSHKRVEPIRKILIIPTCTEKCEDGGSPSTEEIFHEIQRTGTESSILLVGSCCVVSESKIIRLREMTTLDILIPKETSCDPYQFSLRLQSLEEQAESLAARLRTLRLMQKMDWC